MGGGGQHQAILSARHGREGYSRRSSISLATPTADAGFAIHEPHYFILGAKAICRNHHFLVSTGQEQIRSIFAAITGRSDPFGGQKAESLIQKLPG